MTADAEPSDARLVERVRAGDRDAFADVYERYADRLFDFAVGMLRNRDDAADAVAESFILMAERLHQLRDPDRLRSWLYAVVRHECLRLIRARTRVTSGDDEQLAALPDPGASPEEQAESAAMRELVWAAAAGLGERDQALLDLHLRHGLDGQELAEALGITPGNAYTSLNRLKSQLERSLGALLIARLGRDDCADLGSILRGWDGRFTVLLRKRVARHVDGCLGCSDRRAALSPLAAVSGVPFLVAPPALRDRVLGDLSLGDLSLVSGGSDDPGMSAEGAGTGVGRSATGGPARAAADVRRKRLAQALPVVVASGVIAVLGVVGLRDRGADTVSPTVAPPGLSASTSPTEAPSILPSRDPLRPAPSPSPSGATAAPPTAATDPATGPSSPPAAPSGLVITPPVLDLGDLARAGTVTLTHNGEGPLDYSLTTPAAWIGLPEGGSIKPGESVGLVLFVGRSLLAPGLSEAVVSVAWPGGSGSITVRASRSDDPGASPSDGPTLRAP